MKGSAMFEVEDNWNLKQKHYTPH